MRTRLFALPMIAAAGLATAAPALAQSNVDYSSLTSAVDFSAVITALLAVAAIVAGVLVARKGIRFILAAFK